MLRQIDDSLAASKPVLKQEEGDDARNAPQGLVMQIAEFQRLIEQIYYARDKARGTSGTFQWFVEEVGELAGALRDADQAQLRNEFADVLAWLATLASITGVDLESAAAEKYGRGCPRCGRAPCSCPERR